MCDVGDTLAEGLLPVFEYVDTAAARNGVGSLGMVETRYVGMKSRGEYHAPGHTVLLESHRDLEGLCLTGSVIAEKERRMPDFAGLVYNGYWFDPVAEAHRAFFAATQKHVTGETRVALYKGNVIVEGRRSPVSLYDADVATMDGEGESYRQVAQKLLFKNGKLTKVILKGSRSIVRFVKLQTRFFGELPYVRCVLSPARANQKVRQRP